MGGMSATLASGYHEAGTHSFRWDASGKASGLYFARLIVTDASGTRSYTKTNKLLLAK